MAKRKIHTVEDHETLLRQRSQEVTVIDDKINNLVQDLLETLRSGDDLGRVGVGLAAPQIGESLRVCVIEYKGDTGKDGKKSNELPTTILINPTIVKTSNEKELLDEGCFSVPELYGPVVRPKKIKLVATDLKGKRISINASGYYARVIQHEIDHLDGILYTDLVEKGKLYKYVKNTEGNWDVEY